VTWALALAVSHSMQLPSPGAGAVMLPIQKKLNVLMLLLFSSLVLKLQVANSFNSNCSSENSMKNKCIKFIIVFKMYTIGGCLNGVGYNFAILRGTCQES
jgi:hypothetical protein